MKLRLLVFVAFLLAALVGCDRVSTEEIVAQAETDISQGDLAAGFRKLKFALQEAPDNARARWLLGETYLAVKDYAGAEKELRLAQRYGVGENAVLPLLARALIGQKKYKDVLGLAPQNPLSSESDAGLGASRAIAHLKLEDLGAAKEQLASALAAAPDLSYVKVIQAQIEHADKQSDSAIVVADSIHQEDEFYAIAQKVKGEILQEQARYTEAEEAFTHAINHTRRVTNEYLLRGMVRVVMDDRSGAHEDAKIMRQIAPNNATVNYLYGLTSYLNGQLDEALDALEASYSQNDRQFQTIFLLAQVHMELGNFNRARQLSDQAYGLLPGYIPNRKLVALVAMEEGNFDRADEMLRPIVAARPDDVEAKRLMATVLVNKGEDTEAKKLFEELLESGSDSADTWAEVGLSRLRAGEQEDGFAALEKAIELAPESGHLNEVLIKNLISRSSPQRALEATTRWKEMNPESPDAMNLHAAALRASGNLQLARELEADILTKYPGQKDVSIRLANEAAHGGDLKRASAILDDALSVNPDDVQLLLGRANLFNRAKDIDGYVSALQSIIAKHPEEPLPRVWLANYHAEFDNYQEAWELVSGLEGSDIGLALVRGKTLFGLERYEEALTDYQFLVSRFPESGEFHRRMAETHAHLENLPELKDSIEKLLAINPDDEWAKLASIRTLIADGQENEAVALLDTLDNADEPAVLSMRVEIAVSQNKPKEALSWGQKLFTKQRTSENVVLLSRLMVSADDMAQAKSLLLNWLDGQPDDVNVMTELAGIASEESDRDKAMEYLERILSIDQQNLFALNSMAVSLVRVDPERANDFAARAYAIQPDSEVISSIYADTLTATKRYPRALDVIDRTIRLADDPLQARFIRARILAESGDSAKALSELANLLARNDFVDPERAAAKRLIDILRAESVE